MYKKRSLSLWIIPLITFMVCKSAVAITLPLPASGDSVVGELSHTYSQDGETLFDIGRRYDIGYYEMVEANPNLAADAILSERTYVNIPTQFILPPGPRQGLVINLAELRLYYYHTNKKAVTTEPVGIGREGWQTPLGTTTITAKKRNPFWYPTKNILADAEKLGITLPRVMPPGPDNPLGKYALKLGWPTYLIHGTNGPEGVGRRSSAGCIRMFPEDIEMLFSLINVGTKVTVINEPYKVGRRQGQLFFEAHLPLQEDEERFKVDMAAVVNVVHSGGQKVVSAIDWELIEEAVKVHTGLPAVVSHH